jgi:glyoxylase-like metal-dependent hydrolase (beta-lactamase superfamily II)
VDAGHDQEVDQSFAAQAGHRYWEERYESTQRALRDALLIVVTHEHHDHIAGVLRSAFADQIVPKTVLTLAQVQSLQDRPMIPLIRLSPEASRRYRIIDYESFYPLAPGVVLIKSPGHSAGSQMVYVRLVTGKEAIFIGDIVYSIAGIESQRQKPEATSRGLGEDRADLQQQLDWLHEVAKAGVNLIPCHDDAWLARLVDRGVLTNGLVATTLR